jgi:hypothetical protein
MEALRFHKLIEKDGQMVLTDLPCKKGQEVELILLLEPYPSSSGKTAKDMLHSDLVGLWKDRSDIGNSVAYARQLREQLQKKR